MSIFRGIQDFVEFIGVAALGILSLLIQGGILVIVLVLLGKFGVYLWGKW